MENPDFLKEKYSLHTAPEVEAAAVRTETRTGERVPQDPASRIQNYLERFTGILERQDPERRERGIEAVKQVLRDKFVIKPEEVPESAFLLEQRIARDLGHGDVEITEEFKERKTSQVIANQEQSLDKWIDYLASPDAQYPDWAKYWAFRSMLEMGKFEKTEDQDGQETGSFKKRAKDTVASFPSLNPRALAMTIGVLKSKVEEQQKPKAERQPVANVSTKLDQSAFQQLLSTEKFSKIYAQFLLEMPEYSTEGLQEIRGQWVTYPQGSDPATLVHSLEGYPLEWCTANTEMARTQLQGGDFHVYYSLNEAGEALVPRLAIRMQDGKIAEVRGIAPNQNVDPYIAPVVEAKMKEFPDGAIYAKKAADMKRLTAIEQETKKETSLTAADLRFLYEIDSKIEGFGNGDDPRIAELQATRNPQEDMPTVFECSPEQIAHSVKDITADTKAYVGPLVPGIFQMLPEGIEHIYTSFPESRIRQDTVEIGGADSKELMRELKKQNIKISDYTKDVLASRDFSTAKESESADLVRLHVRDLGLAGNPTTDQIFTRAEELGLELCPEEVGPQYRLKYIDQPIGEWLYIGMKQITDRGGNPCVFRLVRGGGGLGLAGGDARPDLRWHPRNKIAFRLRKSET